MCSTFYIKVQRQSLLSSLSSCHRSWESEIEMIEIGILLFQKLFLIHATLCHDFSGFQPKAWEFYNGPFLLASDNLLPDPHPRFDSFTMANSAKLLHLLAWCRLTNPLALKYLIVNIDIICRSPLSLTRLVHNRIIITMIITKLKALSLHMKQKYQEEYNI